jgi:hypothetical protein
MAQKAEIRNLIENAKVLLSTFPDVLEFKESDIRLPHNCHSGNCRCLKLENLCQHVKGYNPNTDEQSNDFEVAKYVLHPETPFYAVGIWAHTIRVFNLAINKKPVELKLNVQSNVSKDVIKCLFDETTKIYNKMPNELSVVDHIIDRCPACRGRGLKVNSDNDYSIMRCNKQHVWDPITGELNPAHTKSEFDLDDYTIKNVLHDCVEAVHVLSYVVDMALHKLDPEPETPPQDVTPVNNVEPTRTITREELDEMKLLNQ